MLQLARQNGIASLSDTCIDWLSFVSKPQLTPHKSQVATICPNPLNAVFWRGLTWRVGVLDGLALTTIAMKTLYILIFIGPLSLFGQQPDSIPVDSANLCNITYTIVEKMPVYPAGETEVSKFMTQVVANNRCKITSILFVIDKTGRVVVTDIAAKKSKCDDKIIEQIQGMPAWTPGYHKGEPVCVQYRFQLKQK